MGVTSIIIIRLSAPENLSGLLYVLNLRATMLSRCKILTLISSIHAKLSLVFFYHKVLISLQVHPHFDLIFVTNE